MGFAETVSDHLIDDFEFMTYSGLDWRLPLTC